MSGIQNPKDVFQFIDHPDTKRSLKDQLLFNSQLIRNSIQHSKYQIAFHYFQEIRDFQLKVKKLDEADIYLQKAQPVLQIQIDEFFNTFSRLFQFSIRQIDKEDLEKLQSLLNRLYSMQVLKDVVPENIVMSSHQLQAKVIDIVQNIYIEQVYQTRIDDEKWKLIIEKTRVISDSPIMGFMKEKYNQIYSEFQSKINASINEYRQTINKEYKKYFEGKDELQEEELNSAQLFLLSQKASTFLSESHGLSVLSSLNSILDEIIDKIKEKIEKDTCIFKWSSQENWSSSIIESQFKDINLEYLNLLIASLEIFVSNYKEITESFTNLKQQVEANLKQYLELLIKINMKLLGEANKENSLKNFDTQIKNMFSTFQFASQDSSLHQYQNQLFYGKEQLIIESKEKIEQQLRLFFDDLQTQDSIKEVTKQLENIQRMQLHLGEETWLKTILTVRKDITQLINDIIELMQKGLDENNSSIKLTSEQDDIKNIIITQFWYSQLQQCFQISFPDWMTDFKFPEFIVKKQISEIFDEWSSFVFQKQLIEENYPITSNNYMLILIDYVKIEQIIVFVDFLQNILANKAFYLKYCIVDLIDKLCKATDQVKDVIMGQSKVLSLVIEEYFFKILTVLQQTNRSQNLIQIEVLHQIESNVQKIVKIFQLLQQLKNRFKTIYDALTSETNDYNLIQTLENQIFSCLSGDSKLIGSNIFDRFNLSTQITSAINNIDLIKLNNAEMIADKLAEMDIYLGKISKGKLSQLKFGELKYKHKSKYDLYQNIEVMAKNVLSKDCKMDGDLDQNYQDISRWLQQINEIVKSKEVVKDVSDEKQKFKTILDYLKKAILYHIQEIKKYIDYNDNERIFEVQLIKNAKVHFIKIDKMNYYLNEFISQELNCRDSLEFFIKQLTKRIQQQRDSIKMIIFSNRNYDEGLKRLNSIIDSLDNLDMSQDNCQFFKFGDNIDKEFIRTDSKSSLSLKIVQSSNSVFRNYQNENKKLQGTFPYINEFQAIKDKIKEEISLLQHRLNKEDAEFYDIIKKYDVAKIIDSFSEIKSHINYNEMIIKVKEIGQQIRKKTLYDLKVIKYEKYNVEDEDQCLEIIKHQYEKLNLIKSIQNQFPISMKKQLTEKIELAQNHIKEIE